MQVQCLRAKMQAPRSAQGNAASLPMPTPAKIGVRFACPSYPWCREVNPLLLRVVFCYGGRNAAKEPEAITITLPDGKELDGQSWRTTPLEIAEGISKGLALNTIVSKVNDVVWDLQRPLEESCTLEFIKFDSEEGKYVSGLNPSPSPFAPYLLAVHVVFPPPAFLFCQSQNQLSFLRV